MTTANFTSNAEVTALVEGFENASIPASDFTHRAHIAVALSYMDEMAPDAALTRMRRHIRSFARHHGADQLYHETLTVFWMRLLAHLNKVYRVDLPLWQRINLITTRWGTRLPVEAHYSKELINSAAARANWFPPDRLPLPF